MEKSKRFIIIVALCVIVMLVIPVLMRLFSAKDLSYEIYCAVIGTILTAIITLVLLSGQTKSEEMKERNSKIFEEKLKIYKDFLEKLCMVVQDQKIDPCEEIQLEFQVANIAMHTSEASILTISQQVADIVKRIKRNEEQSNEMLEQLFVIADTFANELYNEQLSVDEKKRNETIMNFRSFLIGEEGVDSYEAMCRESIISDYGNQTNTSNLNDEDRAKLLMAKIPANGSRQWIYNHSTLVHEFNADRSAKTGNLIKGNNTIVIDMTPDGDEYEILLFTRQYSEAETRKLIQGIWNGKEEFRPSHNGTRHIYKVLPKKTSDEEIIEIFNTLLAAVHDYRNKTY